MNHAHAQRATMARVSYLARTPDVRRARWTGACHVCPSVLERLRWPRRQMPGPGCAPAGEIRSSGARLLISVGDWHPNGSRPDGPVVLSGLYRLVPRDGEEAWCQFGLEIPERLAAERS